MHNIIPDFIIKNYHAGRFNGSFRAASMFLDISGFSTMTDELMQHGQHGAEVLAKMMRTVFDPIVDAIFGRGGMIVGYAGDSITALYSIDSDDSSAARLALTAAYSIQQGLKSRPVHQTPYGNFRISAKIGVSIGLVSWGILRSRNGERATYFFRGVAIEDAAQAERQANAGDIIFVKKIRDALKLDVKAEQLGSFYRLEWLPEEFSLPQPVDLQPMDPAVASVFVPVDLIHRDLLGEFRQAVNLFLRMPNLTAEQLETFMYSFFDLQARYGGLIDRIDFGDKGCNMIVFWGAPMAYENDIGRALNFTLGLKSQFDFPITAGLTYYISHAGYIGGRSYENYTCYGWGINLAARFMMAAPDGEVWLDERVVQRLQEHYVFEYVGKQNFKGFALKQSVYVLRGRKSRGEEFFQGSMIGRDDELNKLTDFVNPIWSGKYAGILSVWGEAGMGKSRLIYEFRHSALFQQHHAYWALCQSDQILHNSFNPICYWLFRYFDLLSIEDKSIRLQKFQKKVEDLVSATKDQELATELRRTRSFLAALVDLSWPDSLYAQLDAQGRYDNTMIALISLIKAESLQHPFLLFIEDAHYLDEDSKAFLLRLKRLLLSENTDYPIAILMTTRWQAIRTLLEDPLVDHDIDLDGLSNDAISQIATEILGQAVDPALVQLVDDRAEGNPFFAEQILRYLQAQENLEQSSTGWMIKKDWRSSALPADINTMLIARLDQLAYQVREVVHAASVLGREFEIQLLSRMLIDDLTLDHEIVAAEKASIWIPLNEIRYIFKHSLMRDVAYNMQLEARRQELHAIALSALEEVYENELHHHYGELAYHSEHARLEEKALEYLGKAGQTARDVYRNLEAIDYYSRALVFIPPDDLAKQFDILFERSALYGRRGDRSSQLKDLDALETLALELSDEKYKALVWKIKAEYFYTISDFASSIESAKNAKKFAKDLNAADVLLSAYATSALSLLRFGKLDEAMQEAEEGLALARRFKVRSEEGKILNSMGLIAIEQKEPQSAKDHLDKSVLIARELGDLVLEGKALNNLANLAGVIQGDFNQARNYYEQAYAIVHERGDRYGEGLIITNLGWCAGMQGDFEAARKYLEKSVTIAREVGNAYQEAFTLINLSALTGNQGDAFTAIEYARQAYEMSLKIGERSGEAWSFLNMGHAYILTAEFEKARQAYENSIRIWEELDQPGLVVEATAGLIQVALHTNDIASAVRYTEIVLKYLGDGKTLDGTEEPLRIYLACITTLEKIKDPRSYDILQSAVHLLEAQVSTFNDEESRRMYVQNVPWRLAIQKFWESSQRNSDH